MIFSMSHRLKNRLSTLALALGLCLLAAAVLVLLLRKLAQPVRRRR